MFVVTAVRISDFKKRCDVVTWIQLICLSAVGNEHKKKPTLLSEWVLEGNGSFSPTFPAYQIPFPLLFTSLTFSEANIVILQGITACNLVDKYPIFVRMSYCHLHGRKKFILLSWSCRQDVPLTCWYVYKIRHTTEDINLNSFCRLSVSLLLLALFYTQESLSVVSSENKTLTRISGFHTAEVANSWIKFINEELHKPYSSRELLNVIKPEMSFNW